ncbi:LacI family DNA-binding transcriptional regulator [Roseateles terrae]|uniref:DNA-binding LacI/PurR family transcriptional regulator n=1 Tax=Roseateles terrae TaxID=431060 RepID=A0ABR6GTV1_9BURK|nr:LacI family DNA-binding transcriptional regulator [Roseateles terrae]MBB3195504.1 DNA-binding LacI/PurR family transcriptional regulator [Roseateles terrae]OWQ86424.1 LacI family transcriptional regulator [Roseateles terrae]
MSAVTIRDIAKASGLSIGTVSRGLRNQAGLSSHTRQIVLDWATQLGYDLSQLRRHRLRRVGFLLHSQHNTLASSPFFSSVLHGAEAVCRREGLTLSFIVAGPTDRVIDQSRVQQLDAYLCAGYFEPEILDSLRRTGKPMVLVDMHRHGIPSVNPDHQHGAFQATSHLLRTGRRQIAVITGSPAHYSLHQRALGYRRALFEAGIQADPDLEVVAAHLGDGDAGVTAAMRQLLQLRKRPDAVVCFNDSAALVAMQHCLGAGLRVPQDIAIVGFDDISAAAHAHPPLSTVRVDKEALGAQGLAMLLQAAPGDAPQEQVMPVTLVVRDSSCID